MQTTFLKSNCVVREKFIYVKQNTFIFSDWKINHQAIFYCHTIVFWPQNTRSFSLSRSFSFRNTYAQSYNSRFMFGLKSKKKIVQTQLQLISMFLAIVNACVCILSVAYGKSILHIRTHTLSLSHGFHISLMQSHEFKITRPAGDCHLFVHHFYCCCSIVWACAYFFFYRCVFVAIWFVCEIYKVELYRKIDCERLIKLKHNKTIKPIFLSLLACKKKNCPSSIFTVI